MKMLIFSFDGAVSDVRKVLLHCSCIPHLYALHGRKLRGLIASWVLDS